MEGPKNLALSEGAMSVTEAVKFSGLSRTELYTQMSAGVLVYIKHGKRRLIARRSLHDMLNAGVANADTSK